MASDNLTQFREWLLEKAHEHEAAAPAGAVPFLALVELSLRFPRLSRFDGSANVIQRLGELDDFRPGPRAELKAQRLSRYYPEASVANALTEIHNALVADAAERPKTKTPKTKVSA